MKVLIKNGMAVDEKHKQYHINGLLIIKANGIPDVFYDKKTSLYKSACPDGTRHNAWVNPDGSVTLR